MIIKGYKSQSVLIITGLILLLLAQILGISNILEVKDATGFILFDAFEVLKSEFSTSAAGLCLTIMGVGGFAKYMEHIGASESLVHMAIKPLRGIKSLTYYYLLDT